MLSFRIPFVRWNPSRDFMNMDYGIRSGWNAIFKGEIGLQINNEYTILFDPFDPTNIEGGLPLPKIQRYHYISYEAEYRSYS